VDLERAVTMTQAKMTFPAEGNYRYKIEISSDGLGWTPVADQTQTASRIKSGRMFLQVRADIFCV
jgi:hypothetical protein